MNKKIKFVVDTTSSIDTELAKKYNVELLQYVINDLDGNLIKDDTTLKQKDKVLEDIENGIVYKTSLISNGILEDVFTRLFKDYEYVVYMTTSTEFTSQYQNSIELMNKFKNLYIINGNSTNNVLEHILNSFLKEFNDNSTPTVQKLNKIVKDITSRTLTFFTVKKVDGLIHSGRIPTTVIKLLRLAKVYPIIKTEEKNRPAGVTKKWNEVVEKVEKLFQNAFDKKLSEKDIESIYISNSLLPKTELNELIAKVAQMYNFVAQKIIVRLTPLPILVYTHRGSFGITIVTKNTYKK